MSNAMPSSIQCPVCSHQFMTKVRQIVDVGTDPAAKGRLLAGDLNVAQCPQCGNGGMLSTPLLYHDPAQEILLVYVPMELNLPQDQREQLIGSLTRNLMSSIPAEARKGYLFSPQTMMTLDGLIERVLEADGVPAEVLEQQRRQSQLLHRLLAATELEFKPLVEANDEKIDERFFQMLAALINAARQAGRAEEAQRLLLLRNKLLPLALWSRQAGLTAQVLDEQEARLELMDRFLAADEEQWPTLAREHDQKLDYLFFQLISAVAQSTQGEIAQRLLALRDCLVDLTSAGQEVKARQQALDGLKSAAESAGGLTREMLLEQILEAESEAAVEALAMAGGSAVMDYSFFILMADKIDAAKLGDRAEAERLSQLREKLVSLTESWEKARNARVSQINQQIDDLLAAEDQASAIAQLLPEMEEFFLAVLNGRAEAAKKGAGQQETAEQLGQLMEQVLKQIKDNAPPEIRLVNELLELDDETAVQEALDRRKAEITPLVLQLMEQMLADLQTNQRGKLADRLAKIIELANKVVE